MPWPDKRGKSAIWILTVFGCICPNTISIIKENLSNPIVLDSVELMVIVPKKTKNIYQYYRTAGRKKNRCK